MPKGGKKAKPVLVTDPSGNSFELPDRKAVANHFKVDRKYVDKCINHKPIKGFIVKDL